MKKLETIQRRKLASAYGGFGSIIETKDNGSLLIDDYSTWPCFSQRQLRQNPPVEIDDPRLLSFLQSTYPNLERLYRIPSSPDDLNVYYANEGDLRYTKLSRYFPTWFYCTKCREMHRLSEWENKWNNQFPRDNKFKKNYPACSNCSTQQQNGKIRRRPLEQIRFCMASMDSGDLADIPFEKLFDPNVIIGGDDTACDLSTVNAPQNIALFYRTSASSDGLQSINIVSGNRHISMAQISRPFILDRLQARHKPKTAYKVILRNGNNVYYPNVIRSLFIPAPANNQIQPDQGIYDNQEYDFIIDPRGYNARGIKSANDFHSVRYDNLTAPFVRKLYAINRLKENAVIPSYTRISNVSHRWWSIQDDVVRDLENPVSVVAKSIDYRQEHFLPVIESYGEGVFLDMDVQNIATNEREIFVHTFSHIVMKELEFQCGYPLSSLKEKIDRRNDSEYGILIYTIGGSEGSCGGLVSLLPPDSAATEGGKLPVLINNALERAKDCPNDPICEEEGGHCFACVDIPEISCCKWNEDLDRRIINRYNPYCNPV